MKKFAMGQKSSAYVNHVISGQTVDASSQASANLTGILLSSLPLEILEEVFIHLPAEQVATTCRLVCCEWKEVSDSDSLWKERCRREGYRLTDPTKQPGDWRLFYFLCKRRRNLLKNCKAEDGLRGWDILQNGGDRWNVEDPMVPHPDTTVHKVFVTSFSMCKKSQMVDLQQEGYNASFMDNFQPDIKITDWCAPRWDCGCEYGICVELLDAKKRTIKTFAPENLYFDQWNDQQWQEITHTFKDYGPGVRYVRFVHGGKDRQFWKGWYGIRVTNSGVEICPSADR